MCVNDRFGLNNRLWRTEYKITHDIMMYTKNIGKLYEKYWLPQSLYGGLVLLSLSYEVQYYISHIAGKNNIVFSFLSIFFFFFFFIPTTRKTTYVFFFWHSYYYYWCVCVCVCEGNANVFPTLYIHSHVYLVVLRRCYVPLKKKKIKIKEITIRTDATAPL